MKVNYILSSVAVTLLLFACAQKREVGTATETQDIQNLILVTTDGFRWQDLFSGMDSLIASNRSFVHSSSDSSAVFGKYWSPDTTERRKKLMPFVWDVVHTQGQLFGNRHYSNKVDCANPYWFSYPGYNEILTGYPDTAINSNDYPPNPHTNVLEFINKQPGFEGKVAAFGAWEAFDRILNKERCGFPVTSAFGLTGKDNPTDNEQLLNNMLSDSYKPFGESECLDVFTHYMAMNHLQEKKPRVLYIAYGETDEWAHHGDYKDYLDAAHQLDKWLKDLWDYVQATPQYKNKTAFLITTDHGRGDLNKNKWTSHGSSGVEDSYEIWMAVLAPGMKQTGEVKEPMQLFQKQVAQTAANLLGLNFKAEHPVAEAVREVTAP